MRDHNGEGRKRERNMDKQPGPKTATLLNIALHPVNHCRFAVQQELRAPRCLTVEGQTLQFQLGPAR